MSILKGFFRFCDIDQAILYGIGARFWSIAAGPITIALIAWKFSVEQQGFYYTISSILALQVFFELGLTRVVSIFASHEFSKLRWVAKGDFVGDEVSQGRLYSILRQCLKWYGVGSVVMLFVLTPAGWFFLGQGQIFSFSIKIPWILAVVGTILNFITIPFFAVILGSGDVEAVNSRQLAGAMLGSLFSWTVILFNGGLYSIFAVCFGNAIISFYYLLNMKPKLVRKSVTKKYHNDFEAVSWRKEIWPMQWKIAISWISGYFIFQLFNPVLFYYHGPAIAGQMGMTLAASNALLGIGMTVITARMPAFGRLIAKQNWLELDILFNKTLLQTILIVSSGAVVGVFIIVYAQHYFEFGKRFLPVGAVVILMLAVIMQSAIGCFASYLRAHKQEPLLKISVIGAILQGISALVLGKYFAAYGVVAGYFVISSLIILPLVFHLWRNCKCSWHMKEQGV